MALGADRGSVLAMVLRGAFLYVAVRFALGIPAAILVGRLIASQLFDVRPWEPRVLLRAILLLVAATLVSTFIPARHAASLDPMQTLRIE